MAIDVKSQLKGDFKVGRSGAGAMLPRPSAVHAVRAGAEWCGARRQLKDTLAVIAYCLKRKIVALVLETAGVGPLPGRAFHGAWRGVRPMIGRSCAATFAAQGAAMTKAYAEGYQNTARGTALTGGSPGNAPATRPGRVRGSSAWPSTRSS